MAAGEGFPEGVEYLWRGEGNSKPELLPAPGYIDKVLAWSVDQLNNESKFPSLNQDGLKNRKILLHPSFAALCGKIFRRIFRVYGIIYSTLFKHFQSQHIPRLNYCYKHFLFFCFEEDN